MTCNDDRSAYLLSTVAIHAIGGRVGNKTFDGRPVDLIGCMMHRNGICGETQL
jgi:hypothetical protein